jgi:hypothetical protein
MQIGVQQLFLNDCGGHQTTTNRISQAKGVARCASACTPNESRALQSHTFSLTLNLGTERHAAVESQPAVRLY